MPTETIRVLHFSNATLRGGAERHMLALLAGLDRRWFRPSLACPSALANHLAPDLPADVELFALNYFSPHQARAAWRLGRLMRRERIDVLHSHLFRSSLCASPIGWLCGVPAVVETPHVREEWRRGWKSSYWPDRFAGRFVHAYIAVSNASAAYLIREKRLPAGKVTVIRNGCDCAKFVPGRPAPATLKRALGFEERDPVLVTLGRLEPQKGHSVLLRAMLEVRRHFPSARLVCVGGGSLGGELRRQIRDLGLDGAVRLVGYQAEIPDWLALADLTVLPSLYEGLPLAAIESLAAGRPVVATEVDGTPEAVVNGKTGLTVPPGEPEPLARAIVRLLNDPQLRRDLAAEGRRWVAERFCERRQVRETEQLYLQTLERNGFPRRARQRAANQSNQRRMEA